MFYWSRFPIVRITLFFIAGILLGIYLPGLNLVLGYTLIIFTVSYIFLVLQRKNLLLKYNFLYGLSVSVIFTCLGFFSLTNANETASENHLIYHSSSAYYSCKIISEPQVVGNYLRMTVDVEAIRNEVWQQATGKILLYLLPSKNLILQYGDRLIIKGFPAMVPPPLNPKEFDYRQYLSFNNIFHQHFVSRDDWELIALSSGFSLERQAILARNYLEERLSLFVHGEEELSIAKALILGKKEDLSKSTKEIFAQAGAMHVLIAVEPALQT